VGGRGEFPKTKRVLISTISMCNICHSKKNATQYHKRTLVKYSTVFLARFSRNLNFLDVVR